MPSDEVKNEEKPKGPPDEDFEELFGKLDISEEKNSNIPLQPIINKNAEDLKELVDPKTPPTFVTQRGLQDEEDHLDGKLFSDHGRGRRTHTRNTIYEKDGGHYDPQSYRDNPFSSCSMVPPPPYPGTTSKPKYRKEQENYQQQQLRLHQQQQQQPQQQQLQQLLFQQQHYRFPPLAYTPSAPGSVPQSALLPGFAFPPQGTNSEVLRLSQSLPSGKIQQHWSELGPAPIAPVFQPSVGISPAQLSGNSFSPAELTHDQVNGSNISEDEAIEIALAMSIDHPQPLQCSNPVPKPTVQCPFQYFMENGQAASSLPSSDIEPDCEVVTPPFSSSKINFSGVSSELQGKKRKTDRSAPSVMEVPQNKSPKSEDSIDNHLVSSSQDPEEDSFYFVTPEDFVPEHKDVVPVNGVEQHLGWSSEPVCIPCPRMCTTASNQSGNITTSSLFPTPPTSHWQNGNEVNSSLSQSQPNLNHFVTGNIPSTSSNELLDLLTIPGEMIKELDMNSSVAQRMHMHRNFAQNPSHINMIIHQHHTIVPDPVFSESFPKTGSAYPCQQNSVPQSFITPLSSSVPSAHSSTDTVTGCGQDMLQGQSPEPQLSDVEIISQHSPHPLTASPSGGSAQDVSGRGSLNPVPYLDDITPSPDSCISDLDDDFQETKIDDNTVVHYFSDLPEDKMKEIYMDNKEFVQENIDTRNRLLQSPLYVAVMTRNYAAALLLLQLGADPSIQGSEEKSEVTQAPLHKAVDLGDARMVDILLSSEHINIEQPRIYDRKTPLMVALHGHSCQQEERNRRLIVRLLVEKGHANVEKLDEQSDKTILMMAIETRDIVLIEYMLQYVDVGGTRDLINRPNRAGNTSLHIAAGLTQLRKEDHLDLLKMLVYFGGNTDAVNQDNKTPKDWKKSLFDEMRTSVPYQPS